jgi:hypothetical protein
MAIEISLITEADIPGAIDAIQKAFADDPYNLWVYNDRTKVSDFTSELSIRISSRSAPIRENLRISWSRPRASSFHLLSLLISDIRIRDWSNIVKLLTQETSRPHSSVSFVNI